MEDWVERRSYTGGAADMLDWEGRPATGWLKRKRGVDRRERGEGRAEPGQATVGRPPCRPYETGHGIVREVCRLSLFSVKSVDNKGGPYAVVRAPRSPSWRRGYSRGPKKRKAVSLAMPGADKRKTADEYVGERNRKRLRSRGNCCRLFTAIG